MITVSLRCYIYIFSYSQTISFFSLSKILILGSSILVDLSILLSNGLLMRVGIYIYKERGFLVAGALSQQLQSFSFITTHWSLQKSQLPISGFVLKQDNALIFRNIQEGSVMMLTSYFQVVQQKKSFTRYFLSKHFFNLSTFDILGEIILCSGAFVVGWLVVSLVSTQQMPVALPLSCKHQKYFHILPNIL